MASTPAAKVLPEAPGQGHSFGLLPLALVVSEQVTRELRRLARAEDNIKVLALCGGATLRPQLASLEHGAHVVVGTPGRILNHLQRGSLDLQAFNTLVLDEADGMLDVGF